MEDNYLKYLDPRFPLLQRLRDKATGTYFHSRLVAEIGFSVARNLKNAKPILVYIGGLYHDIGKIGKPEVFAENQDVISNTDFDAKTILSHVDKGCLLAKSFHLPKAIINIIRSHHGTSIGPNPDKTVKARYSGKKPMTLEESIVFLSDSVEAAVRSKKNPELTRSEYRQIVSQVIEDKNADRQLSHSPLQENDYYSMIEDFAQVLDRIYHARPER